MKKYHIYIASLLTLVSSSANSASTCYDASGNQISISSLASSGNDFCWGEPDYYEIQLMEVGLCSTLPTAPTSTTAADATNCNVVYRSTDASGASVSISNGVPVELSAGNIQAPPIGTYPYGYAKLSNIFKVKGSADFGATRTTDRYCVSGLGTTTNAGSSVSATCASTSGTPLLTTTELVDFFTNNLPNQFSYTNTSLGLTAYLVDEDLKLKTSRGSTATTEYIVGLQTFPTAVNMTDETRCMNLEIQVSQGTTISGHPQAGNVTFDSGPFIMNVALETDPSQCPR